METSKNLFKELEIAEKLFSDGSIKNAQKKVRNAYNASKKLENIPNKLRHKLNAAINKSKYYDEISLFAANPKRQELISQINNLIKNPDANTRKHAHSIHNIQTQWQLLDLSSKPASKSQWLEFNELTSQAWEPCKEYFDEIKNIKINNAKERQKIIEQIKQYVESSNKHWPDSKKLIFFLKDTFKKWQKFAPVLDKDLNDLKKQYFEARKPINDQIKKQENINKEKKELLIKSVSEIKNVNNEQAIDQFKKIKSEWLKLGSAGRISDKKLWKKFNKTADPLFVEKKQAIKNEIDSINNLHEDLLNKTKTLKEVQSELNTFTNTKKSKEYKEISKLIQIEKDTLKNDQINQKLKSYINIFDILIREDDITNAPEIFQKAIKISLENSKSNKKELLYSCVKLEILADIESLKKDQELRNKIQLEILSTKFSKKLNAPDNLVELLNHFILNFSSKDHTSVQKSLWKRMAKTFKKLI